MEHGYYVVVTAEDGVDRFFQGLRDEVAWLFAWIVIPGVLIAALMTAYGWWDMHHNAPHTPRTCVPGEVLPDGSHAHNWWSDGSGDC